MDGKRRETQAANGPKDAVRIACLLLASSVLAPDGAIAHQSGSIGRILAGESASIVLQDWCRMRSLTSFEARREPATWKKPGAAVLKALQEPSNAELAYRRVSLTCGGVTLLRADNWYMPARLSADMRRRLRESGTPFGLVVRPLGFSRRTISARPLPDGRIEIRAVLVRRDGAPFSYVVEAYDRRFSTGG